MAILDLVSPWAATFEAPDQQQSRGAFRTRHVTLLESLRRQREPHREELALGEDHTEASRHASRVANPEWQQHLRDTIAAAHALGIDAPAEGTLLLGGGRGDAGEPLPAVRSVVALFVERGDDTALMVALACGLASVTRWVAADTRSAVAEHLGERWDRWELARVIPLEEWAYAEGVGLHLAAALFPDLEPHTLMGLSRGSYHRLRERERLLRSHFSDDLGRSGLGPVVRWLTAGAPVSARTLGTLVIPPQAGRYLAWRMTAERVARVGLAEAVRMPA